MEFLLLTNAFNNESKEEESNDQLKIRYKITIGAMSRHVGAKAIL